MSWIWRVGPPLVSGIMAICFRLVVEGAEHVPRSGPVILACNHVSVLDGPALAAVTGWRCRRAPSFLIAAEIFKGPWGPIIREAHQIPVRRGRGDMGALDDAIVAVRAGGCAGIFPEGRVAADPSLGLQRIRSGLTRIALPTGAPVIPVGIWGTQTAWPRRGPRWNALAMRPRVALVYGGPILTTRHEDSPELPEAFRRRVGVAIEAQIERARALAGVPT